MVVGADKDSQKAESVDYLALSKEAGCRLLSMPAG
jgi:hypothetical protein